MRGLTSLALALVVSGALHAATEQRPPVKDVSVIRIGNYGAPSKQLATREEVGEVLEELNALRKKPWRRGEARLSCYSTLTMMNGPKTVAVFRVGGDQVVERSLEKGQPGFSFEIGEADLPKIRKLLAEIPPAICK
jgi:hypothetical protein